MSTFLFHTCSIIFLFEGSGSRLGVSLVTVEASREVDMMLTCLLSTGFHSADFKGWDFVTFF